MSEYTLRILNQSLIIPWSEIDKEMLFIQNGVWGEHLAQDKKSIADILKRVFRRITDLSKILDNLPDNATILDIGAGNGLTDLAIHTLFPHKNFKFILVDDGDSYPPIVENNKFYGETSYNTYNSWNFLSKAIAINNFPPENFITKSPKDIWANDNQIDLIVTFASWGWHYPIDVYLDTSFNLLKEGGFVYVDPLLNINQSLDKITTKCSKVFFANSIPYANAFSNKNKWGDFLIRQYNLSEDNFSFRFLGQK